jgi:hypothetical protein
LTASEAWAEKRFDVFKKGVPASAPPAMTAPLTNVLRVILSVMLKLLSVDRWQMELSGI